MAVRYFALIFGIVYTLVGLAGFIPGLLQEAAGDVPPLAVNTLYGFLLGLFPVNILHSVVHLAIGVLGIIAYRSYAASKRIAQFAATAFILLTIMGVIPGLHTMFGIMPLFGNDVWLHLLSGLVSAVFGFASPQVREMERV